MRPLTDTDRLVRAKSRVVASGQLFPVDGATPTRYEVRQEFYYGPDYIVTIYSGYDGAGVVAEAVCSSGQEVGQWLLDHSDY